MQEQHDDKDLKDYLDGDSQVSRRYAELGNETPPPELDARILAKAGRAVKISRLDSRRAPPFKAFAWAAIVVLSFSLVLNIVFEQAVRDREAKWDSATGRAVAPAAPLAPEDREAGITLRKAERGQRENMTTVQQVPDEPKVEVDKSAPQDLMEMLGRADADAAGEARDRPAGTARRGAVDERSTEEGSAVEFASAPEPLPAEASGKRAMELVADYLAKVAAAGDESSIALKNILETYRAGRTDAALRALTEFRAAHPEHPVSQALEEQDR